MKAQGRSERESLSGEVSHKSRYYYSNSGFVLLGKASLVDQRLSAALWLVDPIPWNWPVDV